MNLFQIFCEIILNSQVIVKNVIDLVDNCMRLTQ